FGRMSTMSSERKKFIEDSAKLIEAIRKLDSQITEYREEHEGRYDTDAPKWFDEMEMGLARAYNEVTAEYEYRRKIQEAHEAARK
ncbi:MAG: hypothetical protein ACO3EZ_19990, partial [Prochlorotrichaceae cyanobacterium]